MCNRSIVQRATPLRMFQSSHQTKVGQVDSDTNAGFATEKGQEK